MDVGWQHELSRLLSTDELKVEVLLALLGAVGTILVALVKGSAWIFAKLRDRGIRKNFASASFAHDEVAAALQGYVFHQGMRSDPSAKLELADALSLKRSSLFSLLDESIVSTSSSKYIFVFADCGMGKTTFLINYFHRRSARLKRKRISIALVSLSHSGYLNEINSMPLEDRAKTVLLMDAFDEDPLVLEGVAKRLDLLVAMTLGFKSVVISCRSQFFSSDDAIPVGTGVVKAGPTPAAVSKEHEFKRLYIAPFDDRQVSQYLRRAFGLTSWRKRGRARAMLNRVPSLVMRPMLLAHISDVLEEESRSTIMTQSDIYQAIVSAWVRRERRWVEDKPLLEFSRRLALDIFQNRHDRGGEFCARDELENLARSWGIRIRPEFLTGRSLLNRTDDGRCKFAHRSILEYLVATAVLEGRARGSLELTGQVAAFIFDQLGISPEFPDGWLDQNAQIAITEPEVRLGYPTNFNIYHESTNHLDPAEVYGIAVTDEQGTSDLLGEFLQEMIRQLGGLGRVTDARISVARESADTLVGYVSVWGDDDAIISRVRIASSSWTAVIGDGWLGRGFYNVVARPTFRGCRAEDLSFRVATLCNFPTDFIKVDSASRCQLASVSVGSAGSGVLLQLIVGTEIPGPLLSFGVLRGGGSSFPEGKKYRRLNRREVQRADVPAALYVQEMPVVTAAERWSTGRRN